MSTARQSPTNGLHWLPRSSSGRLALWLFGAGIGLFCAWWFAIRVVWIALDEPGGDAVRMGVVVTAAGAVGLAGVAGIMAAVRGERALCVLLPIIPQLTVVAFVLAELVGTPGDQYTDVQIDVVLENGRVELQRSGEDVSALDGFVHLRLIVHNRESEPQQVGVMDLTRVDGAGSPATPFVPETLNIESGRVRHYTYVDEPQIAFFKAEGGFYQRAIVRDAAPPTRPDDISLSLGAGETREFAVIDLTPETTLMIFSDLRGRYEAGQWAMLEVR